MIDLEKLGFIDKANDVLERIQLANTLEGAVAHTIYVQEGVTEDVKIKAEVFSEIDKYAPPQTPLASSCSSILPSEFLHEMEGRNRCFVTHPFNPPHLMPAVEVVTTPWNSPELIDRVCTILEEIGQSPAVINKEIPGYVVNRLQVAVQT